MFPESVGNVDLADIDTGRIGPGKQRGEDPRAARHVEQRAGDVAELESDRSLLRSMVGFDGPPGEVPERRVVRDTGQ